MFNFRKNKILNRQSYAKDEVLFHEGDPGNRAFFIESGKVEVYRKDENGQEIILAELGSGHIVGEMAVLSGGIRSASVRVSETGILISISTAEFEKKLSQTDKVFRALLQIYIERIKRSNLLFVEKKINLEDFESAMRIFAKNATQMIAPEKREDFQGEIEPVLNQLHQIIEKYEDDIQEQV